MSAAIGGFIVSIAGAILWGVLPAPLLVTGKITSCFNRRGDSLGGAAPNRRESMPHPNCFNRRGDSLGGAAIPSSIIHNSCN